MKFTEQDRTEIKAVLNSISLTGTKAIPIVNIETISENTWLFLRSVLGIGGSECAGLLNVSPYTNAIKIYNSKYNYLYKNGTMTEEQIEEVIEKIEENNPDKDMNTQFLLDYGHYMEQFIKEQFEKQFETRFKDNFEEQFSKRFGKYMEIINVEVYKDSFLYKHPTAPLFADMDYRIRFTFKNGTVLEGVFECKTASSYNVKSKWTDSFPEYYDVQVRHYMAISDVDCFVIACVADNSASNFFAHLGFRDEDKEKKIIDTATAFWNDSVIPNKMPTVPEGTNALDDLLSTIDVKPDIKKYQLGNAAFQLCKQREALNDMKSQYNSAIKEIDEKIAEIDTQLVLRCDGHSISVAKNEDEEFNITLQKKTSNRFDKNKFFKTFPDQKDDYNSCINKTVKTTVTIKKTA